MKAIDAVIAEVPLATWKEYLTFGLISAYADALSQPFVDSAFEFNGRTIAGSAGRCSSRGGSAASTTCSRCLDPWVTLRTAIRGPSASRGWRTALQSPLPVPSP